MSIRPVIITIALLILAPISSAQHCLHAGSSAQFCNSPGAKCSPPSGGMCRQIKDRNNVPDGCVCSAIRRNVAPQQQEKYQLYEKERLQEQTR